MSQAWLKDSVMRCVTGFHRLVFDVSRGRIAGRVAGMPVLALTTVGRKSGRPRTTMLTSPVQEGDAFVIVASYGGDDRHPQWYLNLRKHPEVEVTGLGLSQKMHARTASPEEKDRLWPRVTEAYKGYAGYQTKTDRDIPLVILEPA